MRSRGGRLSDVQGSQSEARQGCFDLGELFETIQKTQHSCCLNSNRIQKGCLQPIASYYGPRPWTSAPLAMPFFVFLTLLATNACMPYVVFPSSFHTSRSAHALACSRPQSLWAPKTHTHTQQCHRKCYYLGARMQKNDRGPKVRVRV